MVIFLPRSAWTSTDSASNGEWLTRLGISVHYPAAGTAPLGGLSQEQVATRLRGWRTLHTASRGWSDIGYNYAVDQAGRVWTLRGMDNVGVHSAHKGYDPQANQKYLGVLFVVGNTERPTPQAVEAFKALRAQWLARFPAATIIRGHGDLGPTQCPGVPLKALIAAGALSGAAPVVLPPEALAGPVADNASRLRTGSTGAEVSQLQRELRRVFPAYRETVSYRRGQLIDVDGLYGPQTEAWVSEFQRRAGLPITGMVQEADRLALARYGVQLLGETPAAPPAPAPVAPAPAPVPAPTPVAPPVAPVPAPVPPAPAPAPVAGATTLRKGSKGAKVLSYQKQMNEVFPAYRTFVRTRRGRPLDEDGSFGPQTEAWTREFQRRSNLKRTGIVNAETRAALAKHGVKV